MKRILKYDFDKIESNEENYWENVQKTRTVTDSPRKYA